jgi:hypothetical protein
MAKQTINTGTVPSDGTGDGFRTSMTKVNSNFSEVYEALEDKAASSHDHIIDDTVGLQAALDAKAATSHTHAIGDTTGLQAALDAKAATSHTHAIGDTTGLQAALDAKAATSHTHAIGDTTGLQAALDAKATIAAFTSHTGNTSNPHSVTKSQVGLGNCDNTSDANKPVSNAMQTALNAKVATSRTVSASGLATGGGDLSANRTIDVPVASQVEAEAGSDNSKAMTPLRTAQAIAALSGGGGGDSIQMTGVAFIDPSIGNDDTAEVGNPAKPYATAQAAFDANARIFYIFGSCGAIEMGTASGVFNFIGIGRNESVVGPIYGEAPDLLELNGNGNSMINLAGVYIQGPQGEPGTTGADTASGGDGSTPPAVNDITLRGFWLSASVAVYGGTGGTGGTGGGDGGVGMPGYGGTGATGGLVGVLMLEDCHSNLGVEIRGGIGGVGGIGGSNIDGSGGVGGNGGNGGVGGTILLIRSRVAIPSAPGAGGGAAGAGGTGTLAGFSSSGSAGSAGSTAAAGTISGWFFQVSSLGDYSGGTRAAWLNDVTFNA